MSGEKISSPKKIYISFAREDDLFRRLLIDQATQENWPFEFVDLSFKKPWDGNWRSQCRSIIKDCHGVIVIISMSTAQAPCALWEIKCANHEKIPLIGIFANDKNRPSLLPSELGGKRVINWNRSSVLEFITSL